MENIGMIKRLEVYAEQSEANNFQNMWKDTCFFTDKTSQKYFLCVS